MQYWHEIKRYGDTPIRITPDQATAIDPLLDNPQVEFIKVTGHGKIARKAISGIDPTTDPYLPEEPFKLEAGELIYKHGPILDVEEDAVLADWVKKQVSHREYEKKYANHPSYRMLSKDVDGVWIAFTMVRYYDKPRPDNIFLCTEREAKLLEERAHEAS